VKVEAPVPVTVNCAALTDPGFPAGKVTPVLDLVSSVAMVTVPPVPAIILPKLRLAVAATDNGVRITAVAVAFGCANAFVLKIATTKVIIKNLEMFFIVCKMKVRFIFYYDLKFIKMVASGR
jgi:hypothetical protein